MDSFYPNHTENQLKELLDLKYKHYCTPDFLPEDPLGLVHEFTNPADQEIIGLLVATIAWGNRKSIINSGRKIIEILGSSPLEFVLNHTEKDLSKINFVHRTFQKDDLILFLKKLQENYRASNTLESKFITHPDIFGSMGRIVSFRDWFFEDDPQTRTSKHVANPLKKSSAKRLNMYLRWMCRSNKEGVDLGIWKNIHTSELSIPLDIHTGNVARKLGFVERTQNDSITLGEIMSKLRVFDPIDPSKYDFALFGLGISKEI
ncbi:MAG: TIGR02757 family protein [Bacteroidetes bacterium]|nr:TIGR02757 family protein [Bacteroidota bacterium]